MNPFVSVIVPTFNRALLLRECVDSILRQTYRHFEIIVVDDGSKDNTPEIMADYPRTKVIRQDNRGVSAARNRGIGVARGDYIAFCDSDDLWQPDKLQTQIDFFKSNSQAMVCYTDEIWIRCGRRINPCKHHQKISGWIFDKCLELCIVSPSSVMMQQSFFTIAGLFDESLPACEDYDLWLRASLKIPFYFIPQPLIIKRGGHEDQLSKKYWGMDRFRVIAILKCLRENLSPLERQKASTMLVLKCSILAQGARKRGHIQEAEYYQHISDQWVAQPEWH